MTAFDERYPALTEFFTPTTDAAVNLLEATAHARPPHTVTQNQHGITVTETTAGRSYELTHEEATGTRELAVDQPSRALLVDLALMRAVWLVPKATRLAFAIRNDRVEVTVHGPDKGANWSYPKDRATVIPAKSFEGLVKTGLFGGEVNKVRSFGYKVVGIFL